jgi:hypothetical protein
MQNATVYTPAQVAEKVDLENLPQINKALNDIRTKDNVQSKKGSTGY